MKAACAVCGAGPACLGLRLPGPRSTLPEGRRGVRWACSAACLAVLEVRRAVAMGSAPEAPAPQRQGVLL